MNYNEMENGYNSVVDQMSEEMVQEQRTLMRNVYGWMSLALVITGLMAYYVGTNPALVGALFANSLAFWILFLAEIIIVAVLSARIHKLSFTTAGVMFAVYSLLNGVVLSSIFMVYTFESIASTFFIAAADFAVMALIGTFIKKDLSVVGRICLMGVIGLIIAGVVNLFLGSSMLSFWTAVIGVVIFTALTAYDAQKIKQMLMFCEDNESGQKIALLGALSLYLDFVNLFLYLLRLFGGRRN